MADMAHKERYIETVGRRKTACARVRISKSPRAMMVINDKDPKDYFPTAELQEKANEALRHAPSAEKFKITAKIHGGGIHSQAEALRHGIARALVEYNIELRKELKKAGFLKRDPRMKERRKFGFKKARKAPQWSKR